MANIRTVFDALLDAHTNGKQLKIDGVATFNDYETLRTRLVKFWRDHIEIILAVGGEGSDPLLELSLCGDYCSEDQSATFFLGKPRRKLAKSYSFSIVDPESRTDTGTQTASTTTDSGSSPEAAVNDDATSLPTPKLA